MATTSLAPLAPTRQPLQQSVKKLRALKDDYGTAALRAALQRASQHHAYGAHDIAHILYQEMTPPREHPPGRLQQQALNPLRLDEPSLAAFDTCILKRRNS